MGGITTIVRSMSESVCLLEFLLKVKREIREREREREMGGGERERERERERSVWAIVGMRVRVRWNRSDEISSFIKFGKTRSIHSKFAQKKILRRAPWSLFARFAQKLLLRLEIKNTTAKKCCPFLGRKKSDDEIRMVVSLALLERLRVQIRLIRHKCILDL